MLLDQSSNSESDLKRYAGPADDATRATVARVQALLGLLNECPAEDPPSDLVARTLARIEGTARNAGPNEGIARDLRPHA